MAFVSGIESGYDRPLGRGAPGSRSMGQSKERCGGSISERALSNTSRNPQYSEGKESIFSGRVDNPPILWETLVQVLAHEVAHWMGSRSVQSMRGLWS
ncbi:hypothetical protein FKM82_019663 [Ascaphus truei]